MDFLKILLDYIFNLDCYKIIFITENSKYVLKDLNYEIFDFLSKNYFSSNWENFFFNNFDIYFLNQNIHQMDNFIIYNYIFSKIILNLEVLLLYIESFYFDFILKNKQINYFIWYFYKNDLLNKNYSINLYYNNLLELLKEFNDKDIYVSNLNLKKNITILKINNDKMYYKYLNVLVKHYYNFYFPKIWLDGFVLEYWPLLKRFFNVECTQYIADSIILLDDVNIKYELFKTTYTVSYDRFKHYENIKNMFDILLKKRKDLWNYDFFFIKYQILNYNKYENNFIKVINYRLFNFGLDYDIKINEFNKNINIRYNTMKLDDFYYFRKNYFHINDINLKFEINSDLNFFLKKILNAENAFNDLTRFEKWVQKKGYRYKFKASYLFYENDHWIYGQKGFFSKKINFWIKFIFKKNILYYGKKSLKIYGLPKGFKFFGGYTYWYSWFQDYKYDNERYFQYGNLRKWNFYVRYWRMKIQYSRDIFGKRHPQFFYPSFKRFKIIRGWRLYNKNLTFEQISRLYPQFSKRIFKSFFLSNDIWDTKKFIIKDIKNKKNLINVYLKNDINKIHNNLTVWFKDIIIRKPAMPNSQKLSYNIKYHKFWTNKRFPSNIPINDDKTLNIIWQRWNINLILFTKIKKPIVLGLLSDNDNWAENNKGLLNVYYKKILKISDRGVYLIQKSFIYNKKIQKTIQGFWVKEFSKDILYGNNQKYFITEKLRFNKFLIKDFYTYIKNNDISLMNSFFKNYSWTLNKNIKDMFFYKNFEHATKNINYNTSFIKNYWEKDFYKAKKFLIKKFFWEIYFKNLVFVKNKLNINIITEDIIKKKIIKKSLINFSNLLNKNFIALELNPINLLNVKKKRIFIDILKYSDINFFDIKNNLNNIWTWKFSYLNYLIAYFFKSTQSAWFIYNHNYQESILPKHPWNWYVPFIHNLFHKYFTLEINVEMPLNFYYKLYWNSLNLNTNTNLKKIILKTEYLQNFINIEKQDELFYETYFMIKFRKDYINKNLDYLIWFIFFLFKEAKIYYDFLINKYIISFILLILFVILYFTINILIIILIFTSKPLNNNIYVLKIKNKKNKNRIIDNLINLEKNFLKKLHDILQEDITFGTEQKFIYSLSNKRHPWMRIKLYNNYTKNVKKKIWENYKLIYRTLISEKNIEKLQNNTKLKFFFDKWVNYFVLYRNKTFWLNFLNIVLKYFNDRFYNYSRFVKTENELLNSKMFNFFIKIQQSVIWRRIRFYLKITLGVIIMWLRIIIRRLSRFFWKDFYYSFFEDELVIDPKTWEEIKNEFKSFFYTLKRKKSLIWFENNMEYENITEVLKKEIININIEIEKDQLFLTEVLYTKILDYILKKKDYNIDELPILVYLCIILKEREYNYNYYIHNMIDLYKDLPSNKFIINLDNFDLEFFKLYLKNVDYIIFNLILDLIKDNNLHQELNTNLKKIKLLTKFKEIDWFNKKWTLYNLKKDQDIETKDVKLQLELQDAQVLYRWFTTLGSRFYYLWSLIVSLNIIWLNSLKKINKDDYNFFKLWNIFIIDIQKFFIKAYWEYTLLLVDSKNVEFIKKKIRKIRNIIVFLIIIVSPLIVYINILLILYVIYYILYKNITIFIYNLNQLKYKVFLKYEKYINSLIYIKTICKYFYIFLKLLFQDLETGQNFLIKLYLKIYVLLGNLQLNFFFLKNAFKKGKFEQNWKLGIYYMWTWIVLKFYVFIEDILIYIKNWKKKNIKIKKKNFIKNFYKKVTFLLILMQNDKILQQLQMIIINSYYNIVYIICNKFVIIYIDKPIFDFLYKIYIIIFIKIIQKFWKQQIENLQKKILLYKKEYKTLNSLQKTYFWFKLLLVFTILPIYLLIYIIIFLIIKYYDVPWYKKKIRLKIGLNWKLDFLLRSNSISNNLWIQKHLNLKWYFENFLERKAFRYQMKMASNARKKKRWYRPNWVEVYKFFMNFKMQQLIFWYKILYDIENDYVDFDNKIGMKQWTPIKRLYKIIIILRNHWNNNKKIFKLKEVSRDRFFQYKWKNKNKIIRRYLLKGLINWILYKYFNKIMFTEIKELKNQNIYINLLNYRRYKYKLNNITEEIHITTKLSKIPPQLWFLTLLYDYYYKAIIFYFLQNNEHKQHKTFDAPKGLNVKWKINPFYGSWDIYPQTLISFFNTLWNGNLYQTHLSVRPLNVGWKYVIGIMDTLSTEGWNSTKSWFDVSLNFSSFYNKKYDILEYEGKATPDWRDLDKDCSTYAYDLDLLLKRFNKERRLKSAFLLQAAVDAEDISRFLSLKRKLTPVDLEKADLFSIFDITYKPTLGLGNMKDKKEELKMRWRFERHIIHVKSTAEYLNFNDLIDLNDLINIIAVIYYDVALVELINVIKMYMNWKQKELHLELIDIHTEPSIKININYEQYDYFCFQKLGAEIELREELNDFYNKHGLNRKKYIEIERAIDERDMLDKFKYIGRFFWEYIEDELIFTQYESTRAREAVAILRRFKEYKLVENTILTADIIDIWSKAISSRLNLDRQTFFEKESDVVEFEKSLLSLKWQTSYDWWYTLLKKERLEKSFIFINIMKLTWEQYLHLDITEKEKLKLYKKNTVLFNEKYNIWNLRLVPARIKLPLQLETDAEYIRVLLKRRLPEHKALLIIYPWKVLRPYMKELIAWKLFRKYLMLKYNKTLEELFFILACPDANNKEEVEFAKKYREAFLHIQNIYQLTSNMVDIKTMVQIGWDWGLYYRIWVDVEEFTHTEWFVMRLREYARDTMETRLFIDTYPYIVYVIFDPYRYFVWFSSYSRYKILKYIGFIFWIWIFYYIMYCPGESFYNMWYVIIPAWWSFYCWFLWYFIKDHVNETQKGKDLYLYKYQASKRIPPIPRLEKFYHYTAEEWELLEHEYSREGEERTWESNRSIYIKNKFNTFRREYVLPIFMLAYFINELYGEMWRFRKWSGWDYYKKYDPEAYMNQFGSNSYTRRHFLTDNWERLEYGGNIYNIWYINYYRKKKHWKEKYLDIGLHKDKVELLDLYLRFENRLIKFSMNESDFGYFYFSLRCKNLFSDVQWKVKNNYFYDVDDTLGVYRSLHGYILTKRLHKNYKGKFIRDLRYYFYLNRRKNRMTDWSDYYEINVMYKDFILNAKRKTIKLIVQERNNFFHKKKELFELKRKAYHSGEPLPFEHLINISEFEKHINIMWFNLMKYRFYRNLAPKYQSFDHAKEVLDYAISLDLKTISNITLYYKDEDWSKFLIKINKLNKYIINYNVEGKKLKLLVELFTQKLENNYDLYQRIFRFFKIIKSCLTKEELLHIYNEIINNFF